MRDYKDYSKKFNNDYAKETSRVEEVVEEVVPEPEPEPVRDPEPTSGDLVGTVKQRLNLRADSTKDSQVVTILSKGDKLTIFDEIDGWYHAKTKNGDEGYCMSEFVEI